MNYKVMQRPMFKMGGKAASQGTGITSGLDERVNYSNGAFGTNKTVDELKGMDLRDLIGLQTAGYDKSMQGLQDLRDIVKLQTLGNLATNVLPNIERGGLKGVVDFFQDPMTTQQAISGLTGLKKVDLREKELQGKGLDKFIKGQMAVKKLDIDEQRALVQTATQLKLKAGEDSRELLTEYGSVDKMPAGVKQQYFDLRTILGDLSPSKARQLAVLEIERQNKERISEGDLPLKGDKYEAQVEFLTNQFLNVNFAEGGRVNRAMGTPEMGEQPMANPMAVERKDMAMETQGQGNDAYAMLRARLPQEIPDDVVKLIAYNKEAFADFASIKNQEDVSSFNQKYGVSMNIDVSTV
tara:strand:- start:1037 stop:2095 length:1059 start_codon:yes stop_codon:yes gene_type:complete